MDINTLLQKFTIFVPGFLLAVVCHEVAHGYMALKFGDETAKNEGRLSFNPVLHVDPMGSVIIPGFLFVFSGFLFGWAKPVPVNPLRFKDYKRGVFWVSFAGPLANFALVLLSALALFVLLRFIGPGFSLFDPFAQMLGFSMSINMILGLFNLIPIPPLDGSKMVQSFLNYEQSRKYEALGQYSMIIIFALIFSGALNFLFAFGERINRMLMGLIIGM